jgi:hypothetical protein
MSSQRDKLISQGDLYQSPEGEFRLSIQGEERVIDLMIQHMGDPSLLLLLEQWYAERFEVPGPFSPDKHSQAR